MSTAKIGVFIQARSSSKRLPNKIYAGLPAKKGTSVLEHIYQRLARGVKKNSLTVVLIPEKDEKLGAWCKERDMQVFRGPEFDVRERYRQAARHFGVDVVLRATGDNPCVDPDIASQSVEGLLWEQADIFSYANLPLGVAVEAMTTRALLEDLSHDTEEHREHVSIHIKQNPENFKRSHPDHPMMKENKVPPLRLTLDTSEDLKVIRSVFSYLGDNFRLGDILYLYRRYPQLFRANQHIEQIKPRALAS